MGQKTRISAECDLHVVDENLGFPISILDGFWMFWMAHILSKEGIKEPTTNFLKGKPAGNP